MSGPPSGADAAPRPRRASRICWRSLLEFVLLVGVFALEASWLPPDPNEAHYLCKARHFWQPDWCGRDFFLDSSDSHATFYFTLGWLTTLMSLEQAAWTGRLLTWLALAWGWQRLGHALFRRPLWTVLAAGGAVALNSRFHEAGEWFVGGFEAKSFAYALVFSSLARGVRGQWNLAFLLSGAAAGVHVLVGGWATLALMFAWVITPTAPRLREIMPGLIGGGIFSLPGVISGVWLSRGVGAGLLAQASEIYVYQRLPHHLWPAGFTPHGLERFALLSCVWLATAALLRVGPGERVLRRFVFGALLIAVIGGLISLIAPSHPAQAANMLRYYWFRLADVAIPVGVSITAVSWLARGRRIAALRSRTQWAVALIVVLVVLHFGLLSRDRRALGVPRADGPGKVWDYGDWREACAWAKQNTAPTALFLTPRASQTFKWYAERGEVVTWKDVPQHAGEIIAWWQRMLDVFGTGNTSGPRFYSALADTSAAHVQRVARHYGADYVLTAAEPPLALPCVYQNNSYAIYDLRRAESAK
ncbi:MAG: hypothetical protein JSS27_16620 [Planctomycetes bacterium]|nr:hypothetical protein [Planctomycetota bacterium]